jgi:hypothetical protein
MKRFLMLLGLLCSLFLASFAPADEGMWLYNAFPAEKVQARYGFAPNQQWLDHLRLSSVRFNNGGSGSFVSPEGLTFTNHHVGAECIQQLSSSGNDYMKSGFYAKAQAEEGKCPDLELNQLVGIEDVTPKVHDAVKPGMSPADASQAQRAAMAAIEQDCVKSTRLRCDVVTLYSGEVYNLYKYKKYTDVRLVFAPEQQTAYYGGDPDNFTYPRYDLDIAFFRVYENGKPAHIDNYLRWSRTGARDGDLIFVSGHPGSTGRLLTLSQLELLRDIDYPTRLNSYRHTLDALKAFSSQSADHARIAAEDTQNYENSRKAITGYLSALQDRNVMEAKAADEQKLRAEYKASNPGTPDPWQEITNAVEVEKGIYKPLTYLEYNTQSSFQRMRAFNSELARFARTLVRVTEEKTKPNAERLREYRDSALPSVEQGLFSTAPIYKSVEVAELTSSLKLMQEVLGNDHPDVKKILNGKSPEQAAKDFIEGTKLDDVAVRKQLYEGGVAALQASTDPLIVVMRAIDSDARRLRKQFEDQVDAVERRNGAAIAMARFARAGFTQPPDAGFTLRLSYGAVKGYVENGKPIPYYTTIGGAFQHATEHNNQPPYQLADTWMKAKPKLDLKVPLNFVTTADIIGGNSGSPTVNKEGEVVGIVFDGNIQSLAWNFVYTDNIARAIHVDSRGILEALGHIYNASELADELLGTRGKTAASGPDRTPSAAPAGQ